MDYKSKDRAPRFTPYLEVMGGDRAGERFEVKQEMRLGRETDNDIVLVDPKASRYHAVIRYEDEQWVVQDLGSVNGTFVNDEPIDSPFPLQDGDYLLVGETEMLFTLTVTGTDASPTLLMAKGDSIGKVFEIKPGSNRVGRETDNDIVFEDARASRYHCIITYEGGRCFITDLGSVNGTLVNGEMVGRDYPLAEGDHVTLGATEFVFSLSMQEGYAPPSAIVPAYAPPPGSRPEEERRFSPLLLIGGALLALIVVAGVVMLLVFASGRLGGGEPPDKPHPTPIGISEADLELVYEDDFSRPDSGWDDAFDRYTTKQYGNNQYHIEITTDNLVAWGLANRRVSDFRLEVAATQESGPDNNGYGIIFRMQDRRNFYRYDISGDGFFLLSKQENGRWVTLVDWTKSEAINQGHSTNKLRVDAFGQKISIYANDQLLASVEDGSFDSGNFGFFASTFKEPNLWVSFDNISLWVPRGQQVAVIPTATRTPIPSATVETPPTSAPAPTPTHTTLAETATTEAATVTVAPSPTRELTPTVTPTPEPLPEYVSRNQPLAHGEQPLSGKIAFPLYDPARGTYDIYVEDAAGGNREMVVENASQPCLNSDGSRIAYRSWQPDDRGLMARDLAGNEERWRFNPHAPSARPKWSFDDQAFLFHSRESGETPAVYHTVGTDYQVLRRLGFPIQGNFPTWTPDGRFIYKTCEGGNCGLFLSNIDGTFPVRITDNPDDTAPDVSPDGQTVAFMSSRGGNWDVYTVSIDGENLTRLTNDPAIDGLPTWSPDGKMIAFVSQRDGEWAIWAIKPDGSESRRLFALGGTIDGIVQHDGTNSNGWTEENIDWAP